MDHRGADGIGDDEEIECQWELSTVEGAGSIRTTMTIQGHEERFPPQGRTGRRADWYYPHPFRRCPQRIPHQMPISLRCAALCVPLARLPDDVERIAVSHRKRAVRVPRVMHSEIREASAFEDPPDVFALPRQLARTARADPRRTRPLVSSRAATGIISVISHDRRGEARSSGFIL
jgi:hypothetical protein